MNGAREAYRFGDFEVVPAERLLMRRGEPLAVTPKVFETLLVLVRANGRVVPKTEILEAVWPDTFVDENNLNKNVSLLRKLLGDGFIETVPKLGYRFTGTLAGETHASTAPARRGAVRTSIAIAALFATALAVAAAYAFRTARGSTTESRQMRSIAVLPFRTLGPLHDEVLELGLADALVDRIGAGRRYLVRPTSTIRAYVSSPKDAVTAGKELRVDGVLDGTIQHAGNRSRVSLQLIDVATGASVWSARLDEDGGDVFALEDTVAGAVARALDFDVERRSAPAHAPKQGAYPFFLKARYLWNRRNPADLREARRQYSAAIDRDPQYAAAWAGLADTYILLTLHRELPPDEGFPLAKAAAARALELDPALAEAHGALAACAFYYDRDRLNAEVQFRRAIELNPSYATAHQWYANYLTATGRPQQAIREIRLAEQLDPLSPMMHAAAGWDLYMARRYDDARSELQESLDTERNFLPAVQSLALLDEQRRAYGEALRLLTAERALSGNASYGAPEIARIKFESGADAVAELAAAERLATAGVVMSYDLAGAYAAKGDIGHAAAALQRAFERHEPAVVWLAVDPRLDALRAAPQFRRVAEQYRW